MLRNWVLGAGIVLLAIAAAVPLAGWPLPFAIWPAILGLIMTLGVIFERRGDKPVSGAPPGPDWIETGERFVDPETGRLVTVFHQPRTGERRYVGR